MTHSTIRAWVLGASALLAPAALADEPKGKVYELRTYHANPGKLDDLHKRFRDHTIRLFKKHGITPVGFWTPLDEKDGKGDTLIYLLAFPGRAAADASWKAFRDDEEWKKAKADSEKDGVLVGRVESVYLEPTDYSPPSLGRAPESDEPRVFELRTYVASPGKFEALHKRFREHTVDLFKKHGMTSIAYWVPTDADKGHNDTLIYLLGFPSRDAAKASWKAFGSDPEWQKVYKESQPDGVPLAGKVTSVYLEPTDYSPKLSRFGGL
jgi:hypothetical protein